MPDNAAHHPRAAKERFTRSRDVRSGRERQAVRAPASSSSSSLREERTRRRRRGGTPHSVPRAGRRRSRRGRRWSRRRRRERRLAQIERLDEALDEHFTRPRERRIGRREPGSGGLDLRGQFGLVRGQVGEDVRFGEVQVGLAGVERGSFGGDLGFD